MNNIESYMYVVGEVGNKIKTNGVFVFTGKEFDVYRTPSFTSSWR